MTSLARDSTGHAVSDLRNVRPLASLTSFDGLLFIVQNAMADLEGKRGLQLPLLVGNFIKMGQFCHFGGCNHPFRTE